MFRRVEECNLSKGLFRNFATGIVHKVKCSEIFGAHKNAKEIKLFEPFGF